jgi:hypothetical protein
VLLLTSFLALAWAAQPSVPPFEPDSHCVAYEVEKVTLFFARSEVIGKNCEVSAQVLPEVGGLYHIEVIIPLRGFSSGDSERDQDVMEILKAKERPELVFHSRAMSAEQWKALFDKGDFDISGELSIGKSSYPLTLHSHYTDSAAGAAVDGQATMRFHDFGLSPPSAMAGIVAKARPELNLFFRLQSQRILGADSIRGARAAAEER